MKACLSLSVLQKSQPVDSGRCLEILTLEVEIYNDLNLATTQPHITFWNNTIFKMATTDILCLT